MALRLEERGSLLFLQRSLKEAEKVGTASESHRPREQGSRVNRLQVSLRAVFE